jgi:hypothetical protein
MPVKTVVLAVTQAAVVWGVTAAAETTLRAVAMAQLASGVTAVLAVPASLVPPAPRTTLMEQLVVLAVKAVTAVLAA